MASVTTSRRRGVNASAAIKVACVCATTANITLSGEQTIDGITTDETRVFVKDQTDATEIGIYRTATGSWVREPDFDGPFDVAEGTLVPVSRGTANADTFWRITNTGTIVIDTTSITVAATTVLSSAILNDGSVKMIADFEPNVTESYALGSTDLKWTSLYLSSAAEINSLAVSSAAVVEGTMGTCGTLSGSSDATIAGAMVVSGASSFSSDATISGAAAMSSNATVAGTMVVSGASSFSSAATIGGTASMSSDATISGTATMSSDVNAAALPTTNPGVLGRLWRSTGASTLAYVFVSTG